MSYAKKITVTPEYASALLKLNTKNRSASERHVNSLAKAMENGEWKYNGDTICISGDVLVDGQHRLMACVKSGVPFETLIAFDVDADSFDTKDIGKRRSAADALSVLGEKNTKNLAAALIFLESYLKSSVDKRINVTHQRLEAILEDHPGIRDSIKFYQKYKIAKFFPASLFIGLHYIFHSIDNVLADKFMDQLAKGTDINECDPVYLLRERLMQNTMSKAKLPKVEVAALTIKAWNYTREGRTVRQLKFTRAGASKEEFPIAK